MTMKQLDWTKLGRELRQNSMDAHGEVVDVEFAYGFLLCNSDCFLGDDESWPKGMPQTPNAELTAAYYGGKGMALVNTDLVTPLLCEIKQLWDEEGFGDDAGRSEGIYNRLKACIEGLTA